MAGVSPGCVERLAGVDEAKADRGREPISGKGIEKHSRRCASFRRTRHMKLKGRNAIVTGGSQGFGRAIVEVFLREGANVAFCARTSHDVQERLAALKPKLQDGQWLIGQ